MDTAVLIEQKIPFARPLEGRVALVTGASRGIGRAIAKELSDRGAVVVINFFNSIGRAQELRDDIVSSGGETCLMQGDVSNRQDARRVIRKILDVYGRLDILVNNAGITRDRFIRKMTDSDWLEVIETNLNSHFLLHQHRGSGDDRAEVRADREYRFILRAGGQLRPGELCGEQRRDHRLHQGAGAGAGEIQHHRQRDSTWFYRNRYARRGAGRDPWIRSGAGSRSGVSRNRRKSQRPPRSLFATAIM